MALSPQDAWILDNRLKRLVTAELVAEAARPSGPCSRDLVEVMDFVRRNPDPDKPRYLIVSTPEGFAVGVRAPVRGAAPRLRDERRHATRDDAEHAVLLHRLRDYGVSW
ncbi:hypothetical protein ABZS66_39915 [Dactylosporangium sp. NPDC005572]|uniref:hypothetical protein n=1 Tax=Dactylosporangium sp. NPDC005572 TaxID=3156889 RepID=UPI0033BDC2D6